MMKDSGQKRKSVDEHDYYIKKSGEEKENHEKRARLMGGEESRSSQSNADAAAALRAKPNRNESVSGISNPQGDTSSLQELVRQARAGVDDDLDAVYARNILR